MRCTTCHSYIPEGLPEPVICPQCGQGEKVVEHSEKELPASHEPALDTPPPLPTTPERSEKQSDAFAPYFTIPVRFTFGLAAGRGASFLEPSAGSISFGPEGFSLVWQEGRRWEKLLYRDLHNVRREEDAVILSYKGVDSALTLFHSWLPSWLAASRKAKAEAFLELLGRVKQGLTTIEINSYQRRIS